MLQMWLVKCRSRLVHCWHQAYAASYSENSIVHSPSVLFDSQGEGIVISSKCCYLFTSWLDVGGMEIIWADCMKMKNTLRVKEGRSILHTIKWRKANCTGHILCRNCILKQITEGKRWKEEDINSYWMTLRKREILEFEWGSTKLHYLYK
jgi:hypothetical protein